MGMDDNYHRLLDENMALVETPLIAPSNSYYPQHYKTALYPYNITSYHTNNNNNNNHNDNQNMNSHNGLISSAMDNILINSSGFDSMEKQSRCNTTS